MRLQVTLLAILAFAAAARASPGERVGSLEQLAPVSPPISAMLSIGGGVSNYFNGALNGGSGLGGAWDARLTIPARSRWSGELAYAGSAHFSGSGPAWTLLTHAVETSLRLNYLRIGEDYVVEPFVSAGVGYAFLMTSASMSGGTGGVVTPLATGLSVIRGRLLAEARATYRHAFDDSVVTKPDGSRAGLRSWAATVALGYVF